MNVTAPFRTISAARKVEHFEVLIVGAGISGIGSAYHMTKQLPGTTFVILETQETFGGTWWTHKYPGIRYDSDLHTFGYSFKPWVGPPSESAADIRYKHRILRASWSSEAKRWTIEAEKTDSGEPVAITANFLWMCQGYYRHS